MASSATPPTHRHKPPAGNVIINILPKDATTIRHLADLDKQCFGPEAMTEGEWNALLQDNYTYVYGIPSGMNNNLSDGYIGMAVMRYSLLGQVTYLYSNAIVPKYQDLSYGRLLLERRISDAKRANMTIVFAHTRTDNVPSIKLLTKAGFIPCGYETDYYKDFEDAIQWKLEL